MLITKPETIFSYCFWGMHQSMAIPGTDILKNYHLHKNSTVLTIYSPSSGSNPSWVNTLD